jgi:tetratricopeptide (TPR) repeat protein
MFDKDNISLATEYFDRAYQLHNDGKLENAIIAYQASIRIYPTAIAYISLGLVYSLQEKFDLAIEECKNAIELDPNSGDAYNDIGTYLVKMGREEEAIYWFKKAIELVSEDSCCLSYYQLGKIYEKKGDWLKAIRHFNKAISIDGTYDPAQNAIIKLSTLLN